MKGKLRNGGVNPALRELRQKDLEIEASLGYLIRHVYLKKGVGGRNIVLKIRKTLPISSCENLKMPIIFKVSSFNKLLLVR